MYPPIVLRPSDNQFQTVRNMSSVLGKPVEFSGEMTIKVGNKEFYASRELESWLNQPHEFRKGLPEIRFFDSLLSVEIVNWR